MKSKINKNENLFHSSETINKIKQLIKDKKNILKSGDCDVLTESINLSILKYNLKIKKGDIHSLYLDDNSICYSNLPKINNLFVSDCCDNDKLYNLPITLQKVSICTGVERWDEYFRVFYCRCYDKDDCACPSPYERKCQQLRLPYNCKLELVNCYGFTKNVCGEGKIHTIKLIDGMQLYYKTHFVARPYSDLRYNLFYCKNKLYLKSL